MAKVVSPTEIVEAFKPRPRWWSRRRPSEPVSGDSGANQALYSGPFLRTVERYVNKSIALIERGDEETARDWMRALFSGLRDYSREVGGIDRFS